MTAGGLKKKGGKKCQRWNGFNVSCNRDKCEIRQASCWSALHSHVRSDITFGSLVTFSFFLFRKKLFSPVCWQNGALEILTASTTPTLPFSQLCKRWWGGVVPSQCSDTSCIDPGWGINGKSMRIFSVGCRSSCAGIIFLDLIWLFQELWDGRPLYRSRPLCMYVCIMTYVWVFWLHVVFSASGARDPPNQAWHHTRGPSCYPSLISTSPATSLHYWQGPDCRSNQSTLMANSFQSCAKPIISHPEPRTGPGEIGQAGKRRTGVILGLTQFTTTHSKTHIHTH